VRQAALSGVSRDLVDAPLLRMAARKLSDAQCPALLALRVVQPYTGRPVRGDALRDDLDLDDHPRFVVARQVAGKLVAPRLGKGPLQFRRLSRGDILDL
jgi:hypothetical protein